MNTAVANGHAGFSQLFVSKHIDNGMVSALLIAMEIDLEDTCFPTNAHPNHSLRRLSKDIDDYVMGHGDFTVVLECSDELNSFCYLYWQITSLET